MRISDPLYGFLATSSGLLVLLALVIVPVGWLVVVSFLNYTIISPVAFAGLANYKYVLGDPKFLTSLIKTVIYSGGVTLITGFIGTTLALFLSRIRRGAVFFRTVSMFPWAVPLVISGFIWKWMFSPQAGIISYVLQSLGIISEPLPTFSSSTLSMIAVIVAGAWVRIPFLMIIVLAGIQAIPQNLYEVAKVDGADFLDTLRYITLPLIKPMVAMGLLITTMFSFRSIAAIYSLTGGGPGRSTYVLGLYVIDEMWKRVNFGTSSAASIILFLLISVIASGYIYWGFFKKG